MLEIFTFIVAIVLLLLPISDWTATYILRKATKRAHALHKDNIALKERATIARVLAIVSTINGIFALIRLTSITPGPIIVTILLTLSFILSSVPNLYWLWLYYRNRLHK